MSICKRVALFLSAWLLLITIYSPATAAPIFSDEFDSGPLDLTNWVKGTGSANAFQDHGDLSIPASIASRFLNVVTADGDINGALLIADGIGNGSDYVYVEYQTPISRGNNVVAQFASWGNPAAPASVGGTVLPWTSVTTRPYGPWHNDPDGSGTDGPVGLPQSFILGGVGDGGPTNARFIATSAWQSGPNIEQAFVDAWNAATDRVNAIWIRVWLGNTEGAYGEWSADAGATWNPFREEGTGTVIDLRDMGVGGASATDPVYMAIGGPQSGGGHRWYDHVEIGDDSNSLSNPSGFEVPAELSDFVVE